MEYALSPHQYLAETGSDFAFRRCSEELGCITCYYPFNDSGLGFNVNIVINGRFLTQSITGVQRYAREFVRALDGLLDTRPEIKVTLLSPYLEHPAPSFRNICHRSVGRLHGHLWEQIELPMHISAGATLFCPGNTAPVISLLGGQRVVSCVHDLSYLYYPTTYSRAFRLLYNILMPLVLHHADAIITVSNSERESILHHYPCAEPRLTVVQNGGLPAGVVPILGEPHEDPFVLYVGSLSKRKNFPGMFEVASHLARSRNLRFVFIGGTSKGISDSMAEVPEDLHNRIIFLGQVNDWELLMGYYQSALCLFFPSFYEASPLPPIEAMACGCPIIASAIPSLQERCGDAALYCDPRDMDSMVAAIGLLLDDSSLRESLRCKGLERAVTYSWENCARRTLEVLEAQV
jgi:glycosyltransferase involved in cell wall biosynthesis